MSFKYNINDVVKCSLSSDESYLFMIKDREFKRTGWSLLRFNYYSGIGMPLEWWRHGPGRNFYYLGTDKPLFHNPMTSTLRLIPDNNVKNLILLEDIKEEMLSPLNPKEIYMKKPFDNFEDIIKSFQAFACLSSYP